MKINTKPFEDALNSAENKMLCGPITTAFYKEIIKLAEAVNSMFSEKDSIMKINPCPWCNEVPHLVETKIINGVEEDFNPEFHIICSYNGCPIRPKSYIYFNKQDLINVWNNIGNKETNAKNS